MIVLSDGCEESKIKIKQKLRKLAWRIFQFKQSAFLTIVSENSDKSESKAVSQPDHICSKQHISENEWKKVLSGDFYSYFVQLSFQNDVILKWPIKKKEKTRQDFVFVFLSVRLGALYPLVVEISIAKTNLSLPKMKISWKKKIYIYIY